MRPFLSSANGVAPNPRTLVNDSDTNFAPRIAMDRRDGDFVISYQNDDSVDRDTIVKEFSKTGILRETFLASDVNGTSESSAISIDGFGAYLVVFQSPFDVLPVPLADRNIFARLGGLE